MMEMSLMKVEQKVNCQVAESKAIVKHFILSYVLIRNTKSSQLILLKVFDEIRQISEKGKFSNRPVRTFLSILSEFL